MAIFTTDKAGQFKQQPKMKKGMRNAAVAKPPKFKAKASGRKK